MSITYQARPALRRGEPIVRRGWLAAAVIPAPVDHPLRRARLGIGPRPTLWSLTMSGIKNVTDKLRLTFSDLIRLYEVTPLDLLLLAFGLPVALWVSVRVAVWCWGVPSLLRGWIP